MKDRGPRNSDQGFTLIELLLVCALAITVAAMTAGVFRSIRATVIGNANVQKVEGLLKFAREAAINQRRAVVVTFVPPNQIQLLRQDLPAGTTNIATEFLENRATFTLFAGQSDTPDQFGRNAAIDFGLATQIMFTADGMLTDQLGNPVNGTVFLGQPGSPLTSRAITVFGPTATLRVYAWNGSAWRR